MAITLFGALTIEEVAFALLEAEDISERLKEKGIHARRMDGTVPLGTLTCGEVVRMTRTLVALAYQAFPELADEQVKQKAIAAQALRVAGGGNC